MSQIPRFKLCDFLFKLLLAHDKKEMIHHMETFDEFENIFEFDRKEFLELKQKIQCGETLPEKYDTHAKKVDALMTKKLREEHGNVKLLSHQDITVTFNGRIFGINIFERTKKGEEVKE